MAQIAANRLGNRRLTELFKKWSKKEIELGCSAIIDAVTRRMRISIAELPDGEYKFEDVLDSENISLDKESIKKLASN